MNSSQEAAQFPMAEVESARRWDARLRVFRAGDEVDTFALLTRRYVILIDTTSTPQQALRIVGALRESLAERQLLVVNTHADYDHAWGNAVFAEPDGAYPAPILGHALTRQRLLSAEAHAALERRQHAEARFAEVALVPPTLTFTERLTIDGGDLTVELMPTPGHTEDHCAVWIPELRILLAGDAAEHPFPHVQHGEDLPALRDSLRRLVALDPALVLPCHGGTLDAGLLQRNLEYFAALEEAARAALARAPLPDDWAARDDLPELIGMPYEVAVHRAGANPAAVAEMYRRFHRDAIRSTLEHITSQQATARLRY